MDILQSIMSFISENIGFIIAVVIVLLGFKSSKKKTQQAAKAAQEETAEKPKKKSFREMLAEIEAELNDENQDKEPHIPYKPSEEGEPKDLRTKTKKRINDTIRETMEKAAKQKDSPWNVPSIDEGYGSPSTEGATLRERKLKPNQSPEVPWAVPMNEDPYNLYPEAEKGAPALDPTVAPKLSAAATVAAAAIANAVHMVPMNGEAVVDDCVTAHEIGKGLMSSEKWDRAALVNGVIMAEVLGKPKALRR